jgi:hypothetical protein
MAGAILIVRRHVEVSKEPEKRTQTTRTGFRLSLE